MINFGISGNESSGSTNKERLIKYYSPLSLHDEYEDKQHSQFFCNCVLHGLGQIQENCSNSHINLYQFPKMKT
jgi:hypothetical protein